MITEETIKEEVIEEVIEEIVAEEEVIEEAVEEEIVPVATEDVEPEEPPEIKNLFKWTPPEPKKNNNRNRQQ